MSTIHLVYAHENLDLAENLTQQIGRIGIPFQHYSDRADEVPGQLAARVQSTEGPVLLLITDNFLRNRHCMANALEMLRTVARQNRVLTVVADGRKTGGDGQTLEVVPTKFDRVVHAIQYMNFWQTAYLDLNNRQSDVPTAKKEQFDADLEAVRNIANEIGELFSALKEIGYVQWAQLEANNFALFFRHFGLQEWYAQYEKLAELDQQAPAPTKTAEKPVETISETPAVAGPLVPTPMVVDEPLPHSNGIKEKPEVPTEQEQTAPESSDLEQPSPEQSEKTPPKSSSDETERQQKIIEKEICQTILDAGFWLERGYTERGLELFRTALEQHPNHTDLQTAYEKALDEYGDDTNGLDAQADQPIAEPETTTEVPEQKIVPPDNIQEAVSYDQMGENALEKGDYLLAKYCWDRATELNPDMPGIFRKLALLTSTHLTDYKETAAHYLEEALKATPDDADLHYRLAVLQRDHLDQPSSALQHFRDAVVANPDHAEAWLALAQGILETGDLVQAESLYQHALEVDPNLQTKALDARFLVSKTEIEEAPSKEKSSSEAPEEKPEAVQKEAPAVAFTPVSNTLTVLITGATSGIGRATAECFARHGHRVILTGRRADRLEDIKQQFLDAYQNEVQIMHFDVRDFESTKEAVENIPEQWQEIDLLVNNAGLAKGLAPIHEGDPAHWDTMIDTNIKGLLYMTRLISPGMVQRRKGHIINVGSIAGKEVYRNGNVYCATKFAVDALTRAMRLDLHEHNIRISQVSPGHVEETEFALARFDGDAEKANIYEDFQPLKSSDVAETIYFIASQPPHVNIQDVWMSGTQQANTSVIDRSGR